MHSTRTERLFEWVGAHNRSLTAAVVILALALGAVAPFVADTDEPSFDPTTDVFEVQAVAAETLTSDSTITQVSFLAESTDGGDVLTADAFREWARASSRVLADPVNAANLVSRFDPDIGSTVPGVLSIVDLVSDALPGGLDTATDTDVKAALARVLSPASPVADARFTLSEQATVTTDAGGLDVWSSPAFVTTVVYDETRFDDAIEAQLWLRDVQEDFRVDADLIDSIGIGIDFDASFDEAIEASAPFIFLAVAIIVLLVAAVHRSYWSAVTVASGLGVTMLIYNGVASLVGLKMGSLLLTFIVPIAMISFGVDFYIHGTGRVREMQSELGADGTAAYSAGMSAVFTAMLLAATTSVAAFLSNSISSIEAIVEFGIGAAIALVLAWMVLGHLAPRVLLGIESATGAPVRRTRTGRFVARVAMVIVAVIAGLAVTLAAVFPAAGVAAVAVAMLLVVAAPLWWRARAGTSRSPHNVATLEQRTGVAQGIASIGSLTHGVARRHRITLPAALAIGAAATVGAFGVESGFDITDFLPTDTDLVQSLERAEAHLPASAGGAGFVYIEGDLTDPDALSSLDEATDRLRRSDAEFGRNADGALIVDLHAADLVRMTMASGAARDAISVDLVDEDRDGIPDTAAGVLALFDYMAENGVPTPGGDTAIEPVDVGAYVAQTSDGLYATKIQVQIPTFTDATVIEPAWDALDSAAAGLAAHPSVDSAAASGQVITQFESLNSFSRSMVVSLPIAIVLTLLIAGAVLRSLRFAIAAVVPIGFVVAGVYAFMFVAGYTINVVTATIAAIAVGVGIDFSTHFVTRYLEELRVRGDRLAAIRAAGAGTGGALALSALTSVLGFTVMAFAPTPIFATFGLLTAVMIALALAAALLVLPSVVVALTPATDRHNVPTETLRPAA